MDFVSDHVAGAVTDHPGRGRIDERGPAVEAGAEHSLRDRVQDQLVLTAEARQLMGLPGDGLRLPEQLDEDADLGAKDLGLIGLEDVVDRAELVAAEDVRLASAQRREKDDWRVARLVAVADEARGLASVEVG